MCFQCESQDCQPACAQLIENLFRKIVNMKFHEANMDVGGLYTVIRCLRQH